MRQIPLTPGCLIHVRRRPSFPGATPSPGRRNRPEADLEAIPSRPPRQPRVDGTPHRPVLGLLPPGGQELGRAVQPRGRRGAPRAAPDRATAAARPGALPPAQAAARCPAPPRGRRLCPPRARCPTTPGAGVRRPDEPPGRLRP